MKALKPRTFILFALAALSGVVLLYTSQNVQNAEDRLKTLEREIAFEEERVQMLKAEWAHLNRPERLERLAKEFLSMNPSVPKTLLTKNPEFEPVEEAEIMEALPVSHSAPVPTSKPAFIKKPSPPEPLVQKKPENPVQKDFGDLLGELGGQP